MSQTKSYKFDVSGHKGGQVHFALRFQRDVLARDHVVVVSARDMDNAEVAPPALGIHYSEVLAAGFLYIPRGLPGNLTAVGSLKPVVALAQIELTVVPWAKRAASPRLSYGESFLSFTQVIGDVRYAVVAKSEGD